MQTDSTPAQTAERRCPNCYDRLTEDTVITPAGVTVCSKQCSQGWNNGERHLEYMHKVSKVLQLISA